MTQWSRLLRAEALKLRCLRLTWVVLGLEILFVILAHWLAYQGYQSLRDRIFSDPGARASPAAITGRAYALSLLTRLITLPGAVELAFNVLQFPGFLLLAMLAGVVVGNEFGWGTIQQNLMRGTSRPAFLSIKLVAVATVVVLFMAAGLAVGTVAGGLTGWVLGGWSWTWATPAFAREVAGMLGRLVLLGGVYAAMAVMFAVLFRSAALGAAAAIIYRFFEAVVGFFLGQTDRWIGSLYPYLVTSGHLALVADRNFLFGMGGAVPAGSGGGMGPAFQSLLPAHQAAWLLFGFILVFVGVSYLQLSRQDLI